MSQPANKSVEHNYEIAEKSPKHFEGDTRMAVVIIKCYKVSQSAKEECDVSMRFQ
jgi:hypothetical protein